MGISAKVGHRAANRRNDVIVVQELLNSAVRRFPVLNGGSGALAVDGDCGALTLNAIEAFQRKVLHFNYPDRVVDPGGKTWKKLNANIESPQQVTNSSQSWNFQSVVKWLDEQVPQSVIDQYSFFERSLLDLFSGDEVQGNSAAVAPAVTPFRQGDERWGKKPLGFGGGTIHGYGCAMTSLTMAATYLGSRTKYWPAGQQPDKLTPLIVNNILKSSNAFTKGSYILWIVGGAKALGMTGQDSGIGQELAQEAVHSIDACLKEGGLVLAHVDYKKDWVGDHWILITQKRSNGEYVAIDPAYGKALALYTTPDGGVKAKSHVLLYGRASSFIDTTPENVKNYRVVRYVTLKTSVAENKK
ncbi:hypothetical protein ACNKU7_04545 [Microbulbifer sp. SA54]|uniref:hypothetical protein n=1 Tax=Microbulbifer sp. SA54 TaxID=3401577 RepID=UPI003AACE93E